MAPVLLGGPDWSMVSPREAQSSDRPNRSAAHQGGPPFLPFLLGTSLDHPFTQHLHSSLSPLHTPLPPHILSTHLPLSSPPEPTHELERLHVRGCLANLHFHDLVNPLVSKTRNHTQEQKREKKNKNKKMQG